MLSASAGLCLALAAPAIAAEDPAAPMYRPGVVDVIKLELPPASVKALEEAPEGEYTPGTFSLAETDGTPHGVGAFSTPLAVGIRLKGSLGSFRPLGQKAGFKIKFGKKEPFLGLKKMTLNNMVQDDSMIHESLAYQAFQAAGVPASRTGYADVIVNGQDYGLHLNIETLDTVALEKHFGPFLEPPQHLYEGEYHADVTPSQDELFEVDEGEEVTEGVPADLAALVTAVNEGSGPGWSERVEPFADLGEMTRMWAVEKYAGQWDGYSGQQGELLPNNFYLYSDAAGRFQMLPWGTDQTWGTRLPFEGAAGVMFDDCLVDASCKAEYRDAAGAALKSIMPLDLDTVARCTAARLKPWQEQEPAGMRQDDAAGIAASVEAAREFIADRPGELAAWLGIEAPEVPHHETSCPPYKEEIPAAKETPPSGSGQTPSAPRNVASSPVLPAGLGSPLAVLGASVKGQILTARLSVPGPGAAELGTVIETRSGTMPACRAQARSSAAGPLEVSCRLSPGVRRRLESRWLKLRLRTRFFPAGGSAEALDAVISVPRTRQ
jgi:CotH protein